MDFNVENFVVDGKALVVKSKVTPLPAKEHVVEFVIFDGMQIWYFKGLSCALCFFIFLVLIFVVDNLEKAKPTGVVISNHNELILEAISKQDTEGKKFVYKWKQDRDEATVL